ncbi:MAG: hypothetical protein ACRDWH_02465 [Acidimicrobiia bacterium]
MRALTTRTLVGIVAGLLAIAGGIVFWQGNQIGGGVLARSGLVLGAVWVAWPALTGLNRRWLVPAVVALALAVVRPALLIWLAPALVVYALLRRRGT